MKRNHIGPIIIGIVSLICFIVLAILINNFSQHYSILSSKSELIFKTIETIIFIILGWVVIRLFYEIFWDPYNEKHGKPVPQLLIMLVNLSITFITIAIITVFVYNQSIFSLAAFGGLMSAGVAFALNGPINDAFSSIVMEIEGTYKIGDWLKLHNGIVGRVVKINWRTTTLLTPEQITYVISNGTMVKEGFENYNKPEASYLDMIEVALDHNVPLERGERLLRSAVLSVPLIHNKECDTWALRSWEGGIVYAVRYAVPDHSHWRLVRHQVLEAITQYLSLYNLAISRKLGDYGDFQTSATSLPLKEPAPLDSEQIFKEVDIFQILSNEDLEALASATQKHFVHANDIIVRQGDKGDSMFIIGEGTVEIILEVKDKKSEEIQEQRLAMLTFGQFFGDIALLLGQKRNATVKAKTDVIIYEVTKQAFAPILEKNPSLVKELSRIITERKTSREEALEVVKETADQEKRTLNQLMKGIKEFFGL